jgi:cellulose synthase/poly-beta-1,6-N-acetylglucosamine synthase-like glycosyltransferase
MNRKGIVGLVLIQIVGKDLARKEQSLTVSATKNPESLPRKRLRLQGNENLPRVDVLLPCCGEDVDVILQTVQAACSLDYPMSHFRVLVLDDGQSQLLEKTILELQKKWPHLSYNSRGRQSGQVFAKSGNLNYALTSLQQDFQPEFCAVLDADSIPTREFLRATLPHLLLDPEAALVSTRQYFYNLPNGDPLSQSRGHFYTCQNAKLDTLGIAIDSGSGAVFRRQSIVDVGLYPTYSFSEDWQLSLLLRGMDYKTFQVDEALQFGQVPASLAGHIAQRKRWNIGHAQQIPAMLSSRSQSLSSQLRSSIARNGFGIVFEEFGCLLGFAVVPILLLCGQKLVPTSSPKMVALQFILSLGQVILTWVYEFLQVAFTGHRSAPFAFLENKWLAGCELNTPFRVNNKTNKC